MKGHIIRIGIAILFIAFWILLPADKIPPELLTIDAIEMAHDRIENYVAEHHRLPNKLSDIPPIPGHGDRRIDGWGNPLIYTPKNDGSVILASPGESGASNARAFHFPILSPDYKANQIAWITTRDRMYKMKFQIENYVKSHHRLPNTLADFTGPQDPENQDGWNNPISYEPQPDGSILFTSHGSSKSNQIFSLQFEIPGIVPMWIINPTTEPSPGVNSNRSSIEAK